jgi:hypothetical protein
MSRREEQEEAVGGGETEDEEVLQVLWEDLTISKPAPIPSHQQLKWQSHHGKDEAEEEESCSREKDPPQGLGG